VFIETKLATCTAVTRCAAKGADVPDYLKGINEIIPVIITRDDFGGCWGVNAYLNKRFKDQLSAKSHEGIMVRPLVSMNISCLERMMWVLQEKVFADVMRERIETDPTLCQPFDAAVKYVQQGAAPKLHAHVEAYKELSERLIADFGMKNDPKPKNCTK
jgi:hypothetical protein